MQRMERQILIGTVGSASRHLAASSAHKRDNRYRPYNFIARLNPVFLGRFLLPSFTVGN